MITYAIELTYSKGLQWARYQEYPTQEDAETALDLLEKYSEADDTRIVEITHTERVIPRLGHDGPS